MKLHNGNLLYYLWFPAMWGNFRVSMKKQDYLRLFPLPKPPQAGVSNWQPSALLDMFFSWLAARVLNVAAGSANGRRIDLLHHIIREESCFTVSLAAGGGLERGNLGQGRDRTRHQVACLKPLELLQVQLLDNVHRRMIGFFWISCGYAPIDQRRILLRQKRIRTPWPWISRGQKLISPAPSHGCCLSRPAVFPQRLFDHMTWQGTGGDSWWPNGRRESPGPRPNCSLSTTDSRT